MHDNGAYDNQHICPQEVSVTITRKQLVALEHVLAAYPGSRFVLQDFVDSCWRMLAARETELNAR